MTMMEDHKEVLLIKETKM